MTFFSKIKLHHSVQVRSLPVECTRLGVELPTHGIHVQAKDVSDLLISRTKRSM